MENRKKSIRSFYIAVLVICFASICPDALPAGSVADETLREITDPNEMITVLVLIGSRIHDNYKNIRTWTGQIEVELKILNAGDRVEHVFQTFTDAKGDRPEAIVQVVHEKEQFAIDANKNLVYIDSNRPQPSQYVDYATQRDLGNSGSNPNRSTFVCTPDSMTESTPRSLDKDKNIIAFWAKKRQSEVDSDTGLYEGVSDPRKIFFPEGLFPGAIFEDVIKRIERNNGRIEFDGYRYQIFELKKDDRVDYKIIRPSVIHLERNSPDDYIVSTKIYSEKNGFHYTEIRTVRGDGLLLDETFWEYEVVDEVYLPKLAIEKKYDSAGRCAYEKHSLYVSQAVNQPIDPETFKYPNLHLHDGDLYIDEVEDKEYRYNSKQKTLELVQK